MCVFYTIWDLHFFSIHTTLILFNLGLVFTLPTSDHLLRCSIIFQSQCYQNKCKAHLRKRKSIWCIPHNFFWHQPGIQVSNSSNIIEEYLHWDNFWLNLWFWIWRVLLFPFILLCICYKSETTIKSFIFFTARSNTNIPPTSIKAKFCCTASFEIFSCRLVASTGLSLSVDASYGTICNYFPASVSSRLGMSCHQGSHGKKHN